MSSGSTPSESDTAPVDEPAGARERGSSSEREPGSIGPGVEMARGIAVLMLLAQLCGRAVGPALFGAKAGIANIIDTFNHIAAGLSQLMLVASAVVVLRLLMLTLREHRLSAIYRLLVVPVCFAAVLVLVQAMERSLKPYVTLAPAVSVALLAVWAAPFAVRKPRTRALGIVLGLCGLLAFLQVAARLVGTIASIGAMVDLFQAARVLATIALLVDVSMLAVAGFWLLTSKPRVGALVGGLLVVGAALIAWVASLPATPDASLSQVLIARGLSELSPNPAPLVSVPLRHAVEVMGLLVAAVCLFARRREPAMAGAVMLTLLSRGSTDVPLCAVSLLLAALMTPLICARDDGSPENTTPIVSLFFWHTGPSRAS